MNLSASLPVVFDFCFVFYCVGLVSLPSSVFYSSSVRGLTPASVCGRLCACERSFVCV